MLTIGKTYDFSAWHQLTYLPHDHPCGRIHQHHYRVTLVIKGEVDPKTAFVVDYQVLDAKFGRWLRSILDGKDLNEVLESPEGRSTTSESLARILCNRAMKMLEQSNLSFLVESVTVRETPSTFATFTP